MSLAHPAADMRVPNYCMVCVLCTLARMLPPYVLVVAR